MRMMVREKKKECCKKFCEGNGEKDPWEVVKWAKHPWRIREVIKSLLDVDNNLLNMNEEKAEDLIRDHFVWNEEERILEKVEEKVEDEEVEEGPLKEMVIKVEIALSGTQNSSAPGPDGINYRFIKTIKETI